jgi:hypothetical protein
MPTPVARALFSSAIPTFPLPCRVTPNLVLENPESVIPITETHSVLRAHSALCLDVYDVEPRLCFLPVQTFISMVRIASRCSISIVGYLTAQGAFPSEDQTFFAWAHADTELTPATVGFVATYFEEVKPYVFSEAFSRFANALRLHNVALSTRNSDLALLGFVGALESLFSVSKQELSFRLSFLLANFLGATATEQRAYFMRAKELYKVRSKVSHGDKIAQDEERSAIQLAEHWVPEAEELSRLALRAVISQRLIDTFNSRAEHERFLDGLLFRVPQP